jgi:pyroglutamyl-peptidase
MTRILLTGFEPFGGAATNPSEQCARQLLTMGHPDAEILVATLPVAARTAPAQLEALLLTHTPDWCVMLGLAEGRTQLSIERVAVNLADFRIPDNSGVQLVDAPIVPDGPAAYFSTLPVRAMQQASHAVGVPAELSLSAGAYLCNLVFYMARHICETHSLPTQAGFIHLPATPELALASGKNVASMPLTTQVAGLYAGLSTLVAELEQIQ